MLRDISVAVRPGTPEWPGDTPYSCGWTWEMANGASVNVSAFTMSPHVGTHADAPLHVGAGGAPADELPLHHFVGRAVVVDVSDAEGEIDFAELERRGLPLKVERLLLRTGRTIAAGRFPDGWPTLTPACVRALGGRGLRLVGVDCPSVDARESKTLDTHRALFGAGRSLLENLDLRDVAPGEYGLIALPQKLVGLDAAPVRAVLRDLRAAR